jgi:hypothetical protein
MATHDSGGEAMISKSNQTFQPENAPEAGEDKA